MNAEVIQLRPRRSCFACSSATSGDFSGLFCAEYREYVDPSDAEQCDAYRQGVSMNKKREEAKRLHPAAQVAVEPKDIEAYLVALHTSAWGRSFSITKQDHRDEAVDYIMGTINGVLSASAVRRNSAS